MDVGLSVFAAGLVTVSLRYLWPPRYACELGSRACALVSCVMSAEKTIVSAVEKAQDILAHYVQPGTRDWGDTINRLMDVLDDSRLLEAVEQVKK